MPILEILIIGTAAGYLVTRAMRMNTDMLTTIALGVFGTFLGGLILRLFAGLASWAFALLAAMLGVVVVVALWRAIKGR